MSNRYFSDRENNSKPRVNEEISHSAWRGIEAYVNTLIANGAFGDKYPKNCSDSRVSVGTDEKAFIAAANAEIPDIDWPVDHSETPYTLDILDFIEFCHDAVAEPTELDYHSFFRHHHLKFDSGRGQKAFREKINLIFARNGSAYELKENGAVIRLASPVLQEVLTSSIFSTGDVELDTMLETARAKYLNPSPIIRREALEKLWDAWERLKTIEAGKDKRTSVAALLDKAADQPHFRQFLDDEGKELTNAGNTFQIRHSEVTQEPLGRMEHVDYLFHRLFSMIYLLIACRATDT